MQDAVDYRSLGVIYPILHVCCMHVFVFMCRQNSSSNNRFSSYFASTPVFINSRLVCDAVKALWHWLPIPLFRGKNKVQNTFTLAKKWKRKSENGNWFQNPWSVVGEKQGINSVCASKKHKKVLHSTPMLDIWLVKLWKYKNIQNSHNNYIYRNWIFDLDPENKN